MNYQEFQNTTQPNGSVLSGKILFSLTPGLENIEGVDLINELRKLGAVFEFDTIYISKHVNGRSTHENLKTNA